MTVALMLLLLPAMAQNGSETVYTFRFVPAEDMFYIPWGGNGDELARLSDFVEQYRSEILNGTLPLYVDGYCSSQGSEEANLAMAFVRSNRVKSELIVRHGLVEENFVTANHASGGNYVTVRIVVPERDMEPARDDALAARKRAEEERLAAEKAERERLAAERQAEEVRKAAERAEAERLAREQAAGQLQEEQAEPVQPVSGLSVRANLLRWATLTPDVGVEWRISGSWGVMVNGSWTSWSWDSANRRYALWEVAPEVRYYIGQARRGYLGAMYKVGQFNYKFSGTGRQGDLMGGGLTGGYMMPVGRSLSLDFNIGLGYLNADYERYEVIDGVRVRRGTETKDWWGPINVGVTLVWRLF